LTHGVKAAWTLGRPCAHSVWATT